MDTEKRRTGHWPPPKLVQEILLAGEPKPQGPNRAQRRKRARTQIKERQRALKRLRRQEVRA